MIDALKPHNGRISPWVKIPCVAGLGYFIMGHFVSHSKFAGMDGHTSFVVAEQVQEDGTIEIETQNSRYTLVGPEGR